MQVWTMTQDGFTLQMALSGGKSFVLGLYMVEVIELINLAPPPTPTLEQSIQLYYALIQQARYSESYLMLSPRFKTALSECTDT